MSKDKDSELTSMKIAKITKANLKIVVAKKRFPTYTEAINWLIKQSGVEL